MKITITDRKTKFGPDSEDRFLAMPEIHDNPHAAMGCGSTQKEALGDLLYHFPEAFNVKIDKEVKIQD